MLPIRTVIAGAGLRGLYLTPALIENDAFRIVGLIDVMPERMQLLRDKFHLGNVGCYTSIDQCVGECDFDAVMVLTPDFAHAEIAVAALNAGKYVYVEKPLDISIDRMNRIMEADREAGRRTFVGFNVRFAPVVSTMRCLLDQGVVGRVLTIHCDEFYDGGRTYFRRWNRLRQFGGLWLNKSSHDFDLMRWFAGAEPVSVYASATVSYYLPKPEAAMYCRDCALAADCPDHFNRTGDRTAVHDELYALTERITGQKADLCLFNSDKDTFDHGAALVTFDNDAVATYSCNLVAGFTNRLLRVTGTKASIEGDILGNRVVVRHRDPSREQHIVPEVVAGGHGGGDAVVLRCFSDFVRGTPTGYTHRE